MEHTDQHMEHNEGPQNMKQQIWRTFWILLALTIVDIVLYFSLLSYHSLYKNIMFIVLGVVKAYYIVGIFMHMQFERKTLVYTIILPMLLVCVLVALVLIEGDYTHVLRWFE